MAARGASDLLDAVHHDEPRRASEHGSLYQAIDVRVVPAMSPASKDWNLWARLLRDILRACRVPMSVLDNLPMETEWMVRRNVQFVSESLARHDHCHGKVLARLWGNCHTMEMNVRPEIGHRSCSFSRPCVG